MFSSSFSSCSIALNKRKEAGRVNRIKPSSPPSPHYHNVFLLRSTGPGRLLLLLETTAERIKISFSGGRGIPQRPA